MSVVLLSGRFKIGVSLPSGIEIAAEKRLFSKEKAMCFCDIHDDEVFAPIEEGASAFDANSEEHQYIYAYKAFIFLLREL